MRGRMSLCAPLVLVAFFATLSAALDGGACVAGETGQNRYFVLRASIDHSESLPPVDDALRAGVIFDAARLPARPSGDSWHWIPDWFAGHFLTQTNTCYYMRDLRTGLSSHERNVIIARSEEDMGFQRDARGGIWEYNYSHYLTRTDCGDSFDVNLVVEHEPLEVTPEEVVYRYKSIRTKVGAVSGCIVATYQVESIQTYTSDGPDTIRCVASLKVFDEDGRPVRLQRNVSSKLRTERFVPASTYKGKDMRRSFITFLRSHGLDDLVPGNAPALRARQGALTGGGAGPAAYNRR